MARSAPNCWRLSNGWWKAQPQCSSDTWIGAGIMRPIIYVAAGLILLMVVVFAGGVALLGGGITWVATKKVDVSDPNAAENFRTKFVANCTERATAGIDKNDYQKVALVKQICAC